MDNGSAPYTFDSHREADTVAQTVRRLTGWRTYAAPVLDGWRRFWVVHVRTDRLAACLAPRDLVAFI